jgi:sulfite exporter TauE/SafE/copper chaperone CopZ
MQNLVSKTFSVQGMTCVHCQNTIEKALLATKGVKNAKIRFSTSSATVVFDSSVITFPAIIRLIENLGYGAKNVPVKEKADVKKILLQFSGMILALFVLYQILVMTGGLALFNSFPQAAQGMGYGILFLLGLLTSVHCVAMCGGICLSQSIPQAAASDKRNLAGFRPVFLYNAGRVLSYTVIGGIVGALGSVISFPGMMKGIVAILAGIFMVVMGMNMLSLFPALRRFNIRMPRFFTRGIDMEKQSNRPFYVGLLNGLMPCGPLQAMQLYALSTGSPVKGALSMLLFSLGTVPLLFGFGALSSFLSRKFTSRMKVVSAALVVVLGVMMFSNGMSLSGFSLPAFSGQPGTGSTLVSPTPAGTASANAANSSASSTSAASENVQLVTTSLKGGNYTPITVKSGIPVRWTIEASAADITGCNGVLVIPKYNISLKLRPGSNLIEFTPEGSGRVPYSCWMGMINSTITVIE